MLPADKHDIAAIEALWRTPQESLAPSIPALLTWLKDGNWPVARPAATLIAERGLGLVPHVAAVLKGTDAIWKFWCIRLLVARLNDEDLLALSPCLLALCHNPTGEEIAEGVPAAASEALRGLR